MPDIPSSESLFLRLYLDRHIMARLAFDLRGQGFDVLRTEEAGHDTATDAEQLLFASQQGRAILTFNIRDFALLHDECIVAGGTHPGIIVSQQLGSRQYHLLLKRMLNLLNHLSAKEMIGNMVHLEQFK